MTRFSHRLFARPRNGGGPEEILAREDGAVVRKLRAAAGTKPGEMVDRKCGRAGPSPEATPSTRRGPRWRRLSAGERGVPSGPTARGSIVGRWGQRALGRPTRAGQADASTLATIRRSLMRKSSPYTRRLRFSRQDDSPARSTRSFGLPASDQEGSIGRPGPQPAVGQSHYRGGFQADRERQRGPYPVGSSACGRHRQRGGRWHGQGGGRRPDSRRSRPGALAGQSTPPGQAGYGATVGCHRPVD